MEYGPPGCRCDRRAGALAALVPAQGKRNAGLRDCHTVGLGNAAWRVLDAGHKKRNLTEYEGTSDIDEALVEAVIRVAREVERRVVAFSPVGTWSGGPSGPCAAAAISARPCR